MTYATLMVILQAGESNAGLLAVARDLAQRFDARSIGIAGCQSMPMGYSDGYVPAEVIEQNRADIDTMLEAARGEFVAAVSGDSKRPRWRSFVTFDPTSHRLAQEARAADLLLVGGARTTDWSDAGRRIDLGDLVMRAGRPVLVVPMAATAAKFARVLIGWKDTREARRAVADALPMLKIAEQICVVAIADDEALPATQRQIDDVADWLGRHGVKAETMALSSSGDDVGRLREVAGDLRSDLMVAGAYGHSRLREWMLGGVTRNLLLNGAFCTLLSH